MATDAGQGMGSRPGLTTVDLDGALIGLTTSVLTDLEAGHAPGLVLPRVLGGYLVGPDARADLAFTLGLLHEVGVEEVAGLDCAAVALEIVRTLDGPATHSFYSYRAAETLLRLGGLDDNPRLAHWNEADRANVEQAIDSSSMLEMLDRGELPRNYAVVLTRCELDRFRLGRLPDEAVLDGLVDRVAELLGGLPSGWWDDFGGANFDMYTPDVYLFAEPFADRLGAAWSDGFRTVLDDIAHLATPGGAICWGRSTGALGIAMNIELGATAISRDLTDDREGWAGRASLAARSLRGWFARGLVTAHQHRSTMFYRGPERRAQMTLDLLGKLVQAVLELRRLDGPVTLASPADSFPPTDRLVVFDPHTNASAWAYRSRAARLVVPFVGGFWLDYSPAPRWPGVFEVPVDNHRLVAMLPTIQADGGVRTTMGPPATVDHQPGQVDVRWDSWSSLTSDGSEEAGKPIAGVRSARYRACGRGIAVDEVIEIARDPSTIDALSIAVPEVDGRPLSVEFTVTDAEDHPHTTTVVDTAGMIAHRSFWSEHARVHELSLEPAPRIEVTWTAIPQLRVVSTADRHHYNRALYDPLGERTRGTEALPILDDPAALAEHDVVHVHWPEWSVGTDPDRTREVIATIRAAGLPILWTQHNRVPHAFPDAVESYEIWAAEADGVIHHSEYGRAVMEASYRYGSHTRHLVVPHGHWGHRLAPHRPAGDAREARGELERALGLPPAGLRFGVVGAPRREKDVQLAIDAVHRCSRDDVQLCVWSLGDENVPDDPRIVAERYELVPDDVYSRRILVLDALVMPFSDGMLTTGTMADAIGAGLPTLASNWGYLAEALGESAITYGDSADELSACIDSLTPERLTAAAAAAVSLQAETDWAVIAERTLGFIDELIVGG